MGEPGGAINPGLPTDGAAHPNTVMMPPLHAAIAPHMMATMVVPFAVLLMAHDSALFMLHDGLRLRGRGDRDGGENAGGYQGEKLHHHLLCAP